MKTRELFEELGLEKDWTENGGRLPSFLMRFGPHVIEVMECTNRWLQPVFVLSGGIITDRTTELVESELFVELETKEEGLALLGYMLGKAVPQEWKPTWLLEGEALNEHLPWEKERARQERRPRCSVDREWFRIATKHLRNAADGANETDLTTFSFDGELLRVRGENLILALPGAGQAWPETVQIATAGLCSLPQRLMNPTIEIIVGDEGLLIAGRRHPLVWSRPTP